MSVVWRNLPEFSEICRDFKKPAKIFYFFFLLFPKKPMVFKLRFQKTKTYWTMSQWGQCDSTLRLKYSLSRNPPKFFTFFRRYGSNKLTRLNQNITLVDHVTLYIRDWKHKSSKLLCTYVLSKLDSHSLLYIRRHISVSNHIMPSPQCSYVRRACKLGITMITLWKQCPTNDLIHLQIC